MLPRQTITQNVRFQHRMDLNLSITHRTQMLIQMQLIHIRVSITLVSMFGCFPECRDETNDVKAAAKLSFNCAVG